MPAGGSSPTVRRRRLAAELRRIRKERGLTGVEVARRMEADQSWVSRIESGRSGIKIRDLRALLDLYEVEDAEREMLLELCRQSRQRGWWHSYGDVIPEWFQVYVGLEAEASTLRNYQSELVPGLLQTPDYHRAVLLTAPVALSEEQIKRSIEVRIARQQRLTGEDAPSLWAIMNEAVLRRTVGSPETMQAQLTHLIELAGRPNITVQVLPFSAGAHPAMDGPFILVGFPEQSDPDVVYLDNKAGSLYLEEPGQIARYGFVFDHLRAKALDPEDTVALIVKVIEGLK